MVGNDGAADDTPPDSDLTVAIRFTGTVPDGAVPHHPRNPIPVMAQLLLGVSELERQMRRSVPAHPASGEFSLTPTVLIAGEVDRPHTRPHVATVVLDIRTVPGRPPGGLVQLLTTLAEQIAGEAGIDCAVEVLAQRPAGTQQ